MGSINLIGSQVDVNSIVSQLMQLERQPVLTMQDQISELQKKTTAYQTFNTRMSALSNAVNKLLYGSTSAPILTPGDYSARMASSAFTSRTVTSTNDSVLTATASGQAANGSYSINVTQLARAQTSVSNKYDSADDVVSASGADGFIKVGNGSGDGIAIHLDAGATLKDMRQAIKDANAGVTASIISDGEKYMLMVVGNETGTANQFSFNFAPNELNLRVASQQSALDAKLNMNGVIITSSSNTVKGAIEGVTLNLKSTGLTQINVAVDNDAIVSAVKDIVSAYNAVNTFISSQFAYNATTKTGGVLSGDSTLRGIQSQLQSIIASSGITFGADGYGDGNPSNDSYKIQSLGSLGLSFEKDGSLTLDESKLKNALNNSFNDVAKYFLGESRVAGQDPDTGKDIIEYTFGGMLSKLGATLKGITDPSKGAIKNATNSLDSSISNLQKSIEAYERRLEAKEDLLYKQWGEVDTALRLLQATQASIAGQLASLTSQTK